MRKCECDFKRDCNVSESAFKRHAQAMSARDTHAAREWAWTVIYVLVIRASSSICVDPSVSVV